MREPAWFGRVTDEGENIRAVARLIHHAFAGPIDKSEEWLRFAGVENLRVLRDLGPGGAIVATLMRIPMGQYFGGRAVPMLGIAGVATAPEARGKGHARTMMGECLVEAREEGIPISCLYASTHTLYRQAGYEQAGVRFQYTLPIHRIAFSQDHPRVGGIRPLTAADDDAVGQVYRAFASSFDGMLDRGRYSWERTKKMRDVEYEGFGYIGRTAQLEGYVRLSQVRKPETGGHDVAISDITFTTADAGRGLLRFIADFATMGEDAVFHGGGIHPLLTMLSARHYKVEKRDYWMIRIVDVAKAIAARGYAPGARAEFEIELADDLIPENAGRWRIRIADGCGAAEKLKNGSGAVLRAHIRGFASLYSGLYSARQACLAGLLGGDEAAISAADGAFNSNGAPFMTDMF